MQRPNHLSRVLAALILAIAAIPLIPAAAQQAPAPAPSASASPCPSMSPGAGPTPIANVTPIPGADKMTPVNTTGLTASEIQAMQQQGTQLAAQEGLSTPNPSASSSPCLAPAYSGDLLERLYQGAVAFRFTPTNWPGTDCGGPQPPDHNGDCACAAAVQRVIRNVTGATIGSYNVDGFVAAMESGQFGGGIVPISAARRGAIIIWPSHIGFCANLGCTETLSNSSSQSMFAPYIGPQIWMGEAPMYVWEPQHIP